MSDQFVGAFEVREMPDNHVRLTLHLASSLEAYDKKQFVLVSYDLHSHAALRMAEALGEAAQRSNRTAWTNSADPAKRQ